MGVSASGGCEATAHAALRYARDWVLLKIDMRNAFNSLRGDSFLSVARVRTPGLYSLLCRPIHLRPDYSLAKRGLPWRRGIQQGDPIGPALFALSVDEAARGVQSEFNVWYLDDATLGDSPERVYDDLVVLLERLILAWRSMEANVSSPSSMTACRRQWRLCSEGSYRG